MRPEVMAIQMTTKRTEQTPLTNLATPVISILFQFISQGRLIRVFLSMGEKRPWKSVLSGGWGVQQRARRQPCPKELVSLKCLQWLRKAILALRVRKWMKAYIGWNVPLSCFSSASTFSSSFSISANLSVSLPVCLMTCTSFSTFSMSSSQLMKLLKLPLQLQTTSTSKAPLQRASMYDLSSDYRVLMFVLSSLNSSTATTYLTGLMILQSFSISCSTEEWKDRQWIQNKIRITVPTISDTVWMRQSFLSPLTVLPRENLARVVVKLSEEYLLRPVPWQLATMGKMLTAVMRSRVTPSLLMNSKQRQMPSPNSLSSAFSPQVSMGRQSPSSLRFRQLWESLNSMALLKEAISYPFFTFLFSRIGELNSDPEPIVSPLFRGLLESFLRIGLPSSYWLDIACLSGEGSSIILMPLCLGEWISWQAGAGQLQEAVGWQLRGGVCCGRCGWQGGGCWEEEAYWVWGLWREGGDGEYGAGGGGCR